MKFLLITEDWNHMTDVSGLHGFFCSLKNHGVIRETINTMSVPRKFVLVNKVSKRFTNLLLSRNSDRVPCPSPFVTPSHELLGSYVKRKLNNELSTNLFLTAAENQLSSSLLSKSNCILSRTVAFFHQPTSWLKLYWNDNSVFARLGHIIVLSKSQKNFFEKYSKRPVHLIRHGVNLDFYKPSFDCERNSSPVMLFVGQWLRDFETLEESYRLIVNKIPEARLNCVIPMSARHNPCLLSLARHENVVFYTDISKLELLCLYQESHILFLPLIDSTANNAIVEALACGLPVVSTRVGSVDEYVLPGMGELASPSDAIGHAEIAVRWLKNADICNRAGIAARVFAERNLDWKHITNLLLSTL